MSISAVLLSAAFGLGGQAQAASSGPVAAYAFDKGSGTTVADLSGSKDDATMDGATRSPDGRYGGAASFDGSSSIVSAPDSHALDPAKGVSIEAWVKPSALTGTRAAADKTRRGGGYPYGLELDGGRPTAFVRTGGSTHKASSSTALATGEWHFVAMTYDGSRLRTYADDAKVADTAVSGDLATSQGPLQIGGDSDWGEYFEGLIDNVRVYGRGLSAAELSTDRTTPIGSSAAAPDPSPTPTPSPSPDPTSAPTRSTNCMPKPSACGYPDATNTGVQPGVSLQKVSGVVTLSTPGEVYANKEVTGSIVVTARNVTIRNVRLVNTNPYYGISVKSGGSWESSDANLLVDHVEVDIGRMGDPGGGDYKAIAFNGYTLEHSFIHNGSDCTAMGQNVDIEDSFCVDGPDTDSDGVPDSTSFCSGSQHFDGFQSDGGNNITIEHNTLRNPCSQTSNILLSSNTSPISNVKVDDNLLAGGGYSLYCAGDSDGTRVTNITATDNRFAKTYFPKGGYWGPTAYCDEADVFSGNVWDDTGSSIGS